MQGEEPLFCEMTPSLRDFPQKRLKIGSKNVLLGGVQPCPAQETNCKVDAAFDMSLIGSIIHKSHETQGHPPHQEFCRGEFPRARGLESCVRRRLRKHLKMGFLL